jgi:hypothetical protein
MLVKVRMRDTQGLENLLERIHGIRVQGHPQLHGSVDLPRTWP